MESQDEIKTLPLEEIFDGYAAIPDESERAWYVVSWPGVVNHDLQVKEALELAERMGNSTAHWWFAYHVCDAVRSFPEEMAQYLLTESLKTEDPGRLKECLSPVLKRMGFYKTQAILLQLFPKMDEIRKNRIITCFYWGRPSELVQGGTEVGYFNWWEDKEITQADQVQKIKDSLSGLQQLMFSKLLTEAESTHSDSMRMKIFQLLPREREFYLSEDWQKYQKVFGR